MTSSPRRLSRSIPFWVLVAGSVGSLAGGAYLLVDRLGGMDARLTDGTATTNDVYVGQMWAVLGAILVGVGLIGLALALTLGALHSLARPEAAPPAVTEDALDDDLETTADRSRTGESHLTDDAPAAASEPLVR